MNPWVPAVAALTVLGTAAGCAPQTGTVHGYLGYSGGPPPLTRTGQIPALSGTVIIRKTGIEVARLRADGAFTIRLTPGEYTFTESELGCPARATVRAGKTADVMIICSIK